MKTDFTVCFPWPSPDQSPNARIHHMRRHRARKAYRQACGFLAKAELQRSGVANPWPQCDNPVSIDLMFVPPDRRRRDLDNCIASCKALFDGIADALGVDDSRFTIAARMAQTLIDSKGGKVVVRIG